MVLRGRMTDRQEAPQAIFEWMEFFYNRQRIHTTQAYRTPAEFEQEVIRVRSGVA